MFRNLCCHQIRLVRCWRRSYYAASSIISSYKHSRITAASMVYTNTRALLRPLRFVVLNGRCLSEIPTEKNRKQMGSPITWASFGLFLVLGGSLVYYVRRVKNEKKREAQHSIGKAAIGGPFELVDTEGKTVTDKDLHGKWLLIYFGFCHCPDICPDQLDKITDAINKLDTSRRTRGKLHPVFITVDPHRDSKERIKEYLQDFHPRFIGLTGTDDQLKKACKSYRVYYSAGPKDEDEDYIVDHTVISYLVNPDGDFVEYFSQNRTLKEIVNTVSFRIAEFSEWNKK